MISEIFRCGKFPYDDKFFRLFPVQRKKTVPVLYQCDTFPRGLESKGDVLFAPITESGYFPIPGIAEADHGPYNAENRIVYRTFGYLTFSYGPDQFVTEIGRAAHFDILTAVCRFNGIADAGSGNRSDETDKSPLVFNI